MSGPVVNPRPNGFERWLQRVALCAGAVSLGLGLLVVIGWQTGNASLVQIRPAFTPMQYNAAWCFVLCGIGVFSVVFGRARLGLLSGGISAGTGFLTLLEDILARDFGIDRFLLNASMQTGPLHPARMAPNTSLCFVLIGIALVLVCTRARLWARPLILAFAGPSVMALGLVALFGYGFKVSTYAWGPFTHMALLSAAGFSVLGAGILAFACQSGAEGEADMRRWLSVPIGLGVLTSTLILWQVLTVWGQAELEKLVSLSKAGNATLVVGTVMATLLALAVHLAQTARLRAGEIEAANRHLQVEIGERKRAEEELAKQTQVLRSILDNMADGVIVADENEQFLLFNPAAERMFGVGSTQTTSTDWSEQYGLFLPDRVTPFPAQELPLVRSIRGEQVDDLEIFVRHALAPNGIWTTVNGRPLRDGDDVLKGGVIVCRDITERRRAEEALGESERRYRQLTEAALDPIVVSDQQGRITLFNPAAERTFGYPAREAVGQPLTILQPPEYQELHRQGLQRYLETGEARVVGRTVSLRGRRKDGTEFPLELSLSAIHLGLEQEFIGSIRDLTERNRMQALLAQSEKLASIGLLSAGVAHEINNPLAYVANNLAVLERDVRGSMALLLLYDAARERLAQVDPETARKAEELAEEIDLSYIRDNLDRVLVRTREGVQRVNKIVQSLRSLARTDRPVWEEASIPELVAMSLEIIRGQLQRRRVALELDYDPDSKVRCVPTQISQVLLNLMINAMHAIEASGRGEGGRIRLSTRRTADHLKIEVEDNGCGIDPKDLDRIFDPFFTTKSVGEGTGLGLAISHGIITGHGGQIEIASEPGVGSRFQIVLPLIPPRESA